MKSTGKTIIAFLVELWIFKIIHLNSIELRKNRLKTPIKSNDNAIIT